MKMIDEVDAGDVDEVQKHQRTMPWHNRCVPNSRQPSRIERWSRHYRGPITYVEDKPSSVRGAECILGADW